MPALAPFDPAYLAFIVLPVLLAVLFAWGCAYVSSPRQRMRIGRLAILAAAVWMLLTWRVAGTGILREWDVTPPPLAVLLASVLLLGLAIAFTPLGRRLALGVPLWVLVLVQAFRFPLELAMHRLATVDVMPQQMTYTGRNFDILTGMTALIVAPLLRLGIGGTRLALLWNILGSVLLLNVLVVAILSNPPFRLFGADRMNVFVTQAPFVWLPAVMVLAALAGHLLIYRRLLAPRGHS